MASNPALGDARPALDQLLTEGSVVMRLAERFVAAGHELYLVGGPVRDAMLGRPHVDLDFSTDAEPQQTLQILEPMASAVWKQGMEFGTVGGLIEGVHIEITTFRSERYEPDSRHPEVAYERDVLTDLARRDFTINAMAVRLPDRAGVDPFEGAKDLAAKLIRTPIDPRESFSDDPLRMLRAFRFASELHFKIHEDTLAAITELKDQIKTVSAERIRDEFSKLLLGKRPGKALDLAESTGLTDLFLPELGALKLEQDPVHRHKDVFHHTLAVLERTDPIIELRLGALLHDIGKPKTRRIGPDGVSFHHHEVEGSKMAEARLRALRYPNEIVDAVRDLIFLHHRFHTYRLGWSDSAVRRYVRDAGALMPTLNSLVRADCTTRDPDKARRLAKRMDELEARIGELAAKEELAALRPALDGVQIMAYLGVDPGPIVKEAKDFLMDVRLDEGEITQDAAFERLDEWARERGIKPAGERVPPKEKKK
jgi:poly(A) polymerase